MARGCARSGVRGSSRRHGKGTTLRIDRRRRSRKEKFIIYLPVGRRHGSADRRRSARTNRRLAGSRRVTASIKYGLFNNISIASYAAVTEGLRQLESKCSILAGAGRISV